jgi:hypothetical protein
MPSGAEKRTPPAGRHGVVMARRRSAVAGVDERHAPGVGAVDGDCALVHELSHHDEEVVGAVHDEHLIVEPAVGDHVEDNLNPVGRAYYGFSTLLRTPASLSQDVGLALGAQAGPARIREVVEQAGFAHFRIAARTRFNNVDEVRS